MKILMTLLLLAIGLFSKASAYVVSFTNAPEPNSTAVPILDNAGQPIAVGAGYAAVGTFEVVPTSVGEIRSSLVSSEMGRLVSKMSCLMLTARSLSFPAQHRFHKGRLADQSARISMLFWLLEAR